MSPRHLLAALLLLAPPAASQTAQGGAKAAGGAATCRVIRRLGYPFSKRAARFREVRYALLDTCPDAGVPAARPMIEVEADGRRRLAEFDVVRFFEDRREAERHERENRLTDFKTEVDDYGVLPQIRPVVNYFKALEAGDFALYRTTFDYDWKPRHLRSQGFWEGLRRSHADRLKRLFGDGYSAAELDFRFTPLNRAGPAAGDVDVIHRGRTVGGFMRVLFDEEEGEWKIDVIRG